MQTLMIHLSGLRPEVLHASARAHAAPPLALPATELSIAFGSNWPALMAVETALRTPIASSQCGQPCELESEMLRKSQEGVAPTRRL